MGGGRLLLTSATNEVAAIMTMERILIDVFMIFTEVYSHNTHCR